MRAETVTEAAADAAEREEEADSAARITVTRMEAVVETDPEVAEEVVMEVEEDSAVAEVEAEAALDSEEVAAAEVGAVLLELEAVEEAATMGAQEVDPMIGGEKRKGWQQCAVRILFPLQYRYHHLLA